MSKDDKAERKADKAQLGQPFALLVVKRLRSRRAPFVLGYAPKGLKTPK
jgi:hypothetical protein